MENTDSIHDQLNRLLVEISARRAAAADGDANAEAWMAGMDHWLRQYKAGVMATELIITADMLPLLLGTNAVAEFEQGFRHAAMVNAAGSASARDR